MVQVPLQTPDSAAGTPSPGPIAVTSPHGQALLVWLPIGVIVLDQVVKAVVRASLHLHESRTVIEGLLDLTHVRNTGAAFGMFNSIDFPYKPLVLALVAAVALAGLTWYAVKLPAEQRLARCGLGLIVGGAGGNLIDRVTTGYVLDFVDAYWRGWHFWAFNVADAAITVGVILMIADLLGLRPHVSTPA